MPDPTPQEMCEADGGRYNADGSCTSAADLAEEMALSGAQSAAMAAYMAAMGAVGGAVDPVAMSKAQMYANMAKEASDAAAMATTSAMAMEYQMKAEMNRDMAMEAAGMPGLGLIMLANKQLNGDDIENAELDGSTPPKAVSNATNVDAAIAAAGAPATAAGFTNQGGLSAETGDADTISAVTDTAVADHKAGGSTFTLQLTTATATLLTGEEPSRFQTKGGWEAQDLLYQAAAANVKTHLVVSTDIQADTPGKPTPGALLNALDGSTALDIAGLQGIITAGGTPVITGDPRDGSTFSGTFNQNPSDNNPPVSGVFTCPASTACAIATNADGEVVDIEGYEFRAASTATSDPTPDGDYLAWGFWVTGSVRNTLVGTTGDNTPDDAQAGAFAYGSQPFTVVSALKGTATYNGVANGLYSAGGMVQYFDADAMLEANFGGATNTDPLGAISGSISNIMAAGQSVDGSLTLERANIAAASPSSFAGNTDGVLGGNGFRGQWGGQVFGPAAGTGDPVATTYPTTVAGTFSASTQDDKMSILGAFGAWKAE